MDSGAATGGDVGGEGSGGSGDGATDTAEDTAEDTGGDTGGDTGSPEWIALPDSCALPPPDGRDPFVLLGSEINQMGPWFTEILDLTYLPDIDRVLTAGQGGVAVFDVSDLTDPVTKGHIGAGSGPFERYYHVLPSGRFDARAFATHRDVGLDIISYEDEDTLIHTASVIELGYEGLAASGDRLYVANLQGRVDTFDISTEDSIGMLDSLMGLGRPWDVTVRDAVAYVADGARGLVVLSLSDPDAPVFVGDVASAGQPVRVVTDDDGYIYMASSAAGLEIFEASDPLAPTLVATVDVGGSALDVSVHDGLVGVTTQEAVVLLDIGRAGTPEAPQPHAYQETEQFAMSVDATGGQWMVGDWNILEVWEVAPDAAPAIDLSVGTVAFLDEAETRNITITNRGAKELDLAGIEVPAGVSALVSAVSIAPGDTATLAVSWDGTTEIPGSTPICIASDDPGRGEVRLRVTTGSEGDGRGLGQNAPDFSLPDLDGRIRRLSDELGNPVVLAYFATW